MTAPRDHKIGKLSKPGRDAEDLLSLIMKDMKADVKLDAEARKYTLTDQMKVIDRIAKFEAIKSKIDSDEGSMFDAPLDEDEPNGGEDEQRD